MNLDRALALTGILIAVIGVLLTLGRAPIGWALFVAGVATELYVVWRVYTGAPYSPLTRSQEFKFVRPFPKREVVVRRTAAYHINRSGVDGIGVRIEATGQLQDLACDIARVEPRGASGGAHEFYLAFHVPPKQGTVVTPVLQYRGIGCFERALESVEHGPSTPWREATLAVEFHEDDFPEAVHGVLRHAGQPEERFTSWRMLKPHLQTTWTFVPQSGTRYLLRWSWRGT